MVPVPPMAVVVSVVVPMVVVASVIVSVVVSVIVMAVVFVPSAARRFLSGWGSYAFHDRGERADGRRGDDICKKRPVNAKEDA